MNQSVRHFIADETWIGLTGLEITGILIAVIAVSLLVLSSIQDFAEIWNAG